MSWCLNNGIVVALSFVFLFLLFGCIQSSYSQKCSQILEQGQKNNCIEYMAVWYQDPYTCYEITDGIAKGKCIERAVDPQEARVLQAQKEYEQQTIEIVVNEKKIQTVIVDDSDKTILPEVKQCMEREGFSLDGCTHKVAIERLDISMCEKIGAESYRRPCISNIAITSKDPTICDNLLRTDDKQLCKFYAVPN